MSQQFPIRPSPIFDSGRIVASWKILILHDDIDYLWSLMGPGKPIISERGPESVRGLKQKLALLD